MNTKRNTQNNIQELKIPTHLKIKFFLATYVHYISYSLVVSRSGIFSLKREMCRRGNGASPPLDHLQLGKLPTFNISELMADNVRAVPVERAFAWKTSSGNFDDHTSWSDSRIPRPAAISGM